MAEDNKDNVVMVQIEEAVEILKGVTHPISETERVGLPAGSGRVCAEDITGLRDQPPFPRSPLDGYAVRGADTLAASKDAPVILKVIGKIYAGQVFTGTIGPGECVRLMTGSPIPEGADAVIRQEDTDYQGAGHHQDHVSIYKGVSPWQNYCYAGEDYKKGDILVKKDSLINGSRLGIIAGTGREEIEVFREPRIAVISTGDEVLSPGQPWKAGKIYDSNRYMVYGRLKDLGFDKIHSCHCPDETEEMCAELLAAARDNDLIITTGGVSVGEKDIMHQVFEKLAAGEEEGATVTGDEDATTTRDKGPEKTGQEVWTASKLFWRVKVKPGAPTLAFTLTGKNRVVPVICLTGNPYGVAVNFELLVRPVLSALTGREDVNNHKRRCILENDSPKRGGRRFLRACFSEDSEKVRILTSGQASGMISSLDQSNCLVELLPESSGKAGEEVWVYTYGTVFA